MLSAEAWFAVAITAVWVLAIQIWFVVTTFEKGKPVFGTLGIVGLVVPGLWLFAFFGAIRCAACP